MREHILATLVAGASCVLTAACNHTPVHGLEESFSMRVDVSNRETPPTKIDFLWVIDNSTSMCQEQAALSKSFDAFVESLETSFAVDARIAVTSVAAKCDTDDVGGGRGRFNRRARSAPRAGCGEAVQRPCDGGSTCGGNLDCEELGRCDGESTWTCRHRGPGTCPDTLANGVPTESCVRTCESDEECRTIFGNDELVCLHVAGGPSECTYAAPVSDCPDELPAFLEKNGAVDNSDVFHCIASVGFATDTCLRYEEPLRSAQLALGIDPEVDAQGQRYNVEQAAAFLRADAYLVVIIVSDEEDCSVEPGFKLNDTEYTNCGILADIDSGGPLTPVNHFVNRIKSLKNDPSKVIVAAIAGDSLAASEADRAVERDTYLALHKSPLECDHTAYICESDNGIADYGARLRAFAEAFGPNGTFENICGDEGIGPALQRIADSIIAVVNRMCLPKPILGQLRVTRTRDGEVTELHEGEGTGTFTIVHNAEDCAVGNQALPAISLWDRPQPGDVIDIVYQGDPQLE